MKTIDFSQTGGYRLKQSTFERMQDAYLETLSAFIKSLGIPSDGNHIVSGCQISGVSITSGFMVIEGELCPFSQAEGDLTTKIKKNVDFQNVAFKNGSNLPVWKTTTAIVDPDGVALSDFIRHDIVIDNNYVHTDNNFTVELLNKLLEIQNNAEQNVQTDWDVVNPLSDAYLKNRPLLAKVVAKGTIIVGDLYTNTGIQNLPVTIPDQGDSDYSVVVTIESITNQEIAANNTATILYCVYDKQSTGFKIHLREVGNFTQQLRINYIVLKQV